MNPLMYYIVEREGRRDDVQGSRVKQVLPVVYATEESAREAAELMNLSYAPVAQFSKSTLQRFEVHAINRDALRDYVSNRRNASQAKRWD